MQVYKTPIEQALDESNESLHTRNIFNNNAHFKNREQQSILFNELLELTVKYIDTVKIPGKPIEWRRSSNSIGYLNFSRIFEIMDLYVSYMRGNGFRSGPIFQCQQQLIQIKRNKLSPNIKSAMVIKEILLMLNTTASAVAIKKEEFID